MYIGFELFWVILQGMCNFQGMCDFLTLILELLEIFLSLT